MSDTGIRCAHCGVGVILSDDVLVHADGERMCPPAFGTKAFGEPYDYGNSDHEIREDFYRQFGNDSAEDYLRYIEQHGKSYLDWPTYPGNDGKPPPTPAKG